LDRHPGMTAATLARNSFVRAQTAASLVNALERLRLVERQPDPNSRRQNLIFLTQSGRAILNELAAGIQAVEDRVVEPLSEVERQTLFELLQKARATLNA
jgi:DNA-binding MarR family transcriptional regulator